MTVLTIQDLTIRMAGRPLMEGASLQVDDGRKIGLVGRNGAGKSTLIKAILGELQPDGGEIRLAQRARIGHVAQETPAGETCLLDIVLEADTERCAQLIEGSLAMCTSLVPAIGYDKSAALASNELDW